MPTKPGGAAKAWTPALASGAIGLLVVESKSVAIAIGSVFIRLVRPFTPNYAFSLFFGSDD